jgi:hypothetical protein
MRNKKLKLEINKKANKRDKTQMLSLALGLFIMFSLVMSVYAYKLYTENESYKSKTCVDNVDMSRARLSYTFADGKKLLYYDDGNTYIKR